MSIDTIVHILLGLFFVFNGVNHFIHLKSLNKQMHHVRTFQTKNLIIVSGIVLILGGLSLIFEYHMGLGALGLIGFLVGVTPVVHKFWKGTTAERGQELAHFTKNSALAVELVAIMVHYWY